MTSKMLKTDKKGFMAVTAVMLLAAGTLAFSLATMSAAALYSDAIMRRELRIQAGLNVQACLDSVELMAEKDYFLTGKIGLADFGCRATITKLDSSHMSINATTTLSGVAVRDSRTIQIVFP